MNCREKFQQQYFQVLQILPPLNGMISSKELRNKIPTSNISPMRLGNILGKMISYDKLLKRIVVDNTAYYKRIK